MTCRELIQQLLELPDLESRKRFLQKYASLLDDEVARALKEQADHFLRSDIHCCLQTADLLFYMAEQTGDPRHRALGLLAEANARSIGLGEYQKAIELYDEAAEIYHSHGCLVDQARSQIGKIGSLTNLGHYAEASKVGNWASRILEEHGEWQILAGLMLNLGIMHSRSGDDARSLEMYERAGELYRQLGTAGEHLWLWVQQNRAHALRTLGRFKDSIQASQMAWDGLERLGQKAEAARARQNLALTYFLLGRYNEALEHLDQVRDVFLADERRRDAMLVELFISDCLLQLRRFGDVLEKCRRVRSTFDELGMRDFVAQAIVNEAVAYTELDDHKEALASLAEARQIFAAAGNHVWVALADLETATVLYRQGRYDESQNMAQECAAVFQNHALPIQEAQAHLVAARTAIILGQYDQALRLATEALQVGEKRNVPVLKYQSHHVLGTLAADRKDLTGALAAYDRAIQEVEHLRGRLMIEHRAGFVEDKESIYQDAVGLCLALGKPGRGLEYAERAKSRALLDLLAYRLDLSIQARSAADAPLVKEIVHLRAERDRLCRRWEDTESRERGVTSSLEDRGKAQQDVLALEKRITALWHRLLIRNADYARDASLWTIHTESAQPYLSSDVLLIEYFAVHGQLVAFWVTPDSVYARYLECDLSRIQTTMQFLWLNLKAVPKSNPNQASTLETNAKGLLRQLYDLLLAPLADVIESYNRLIIIPHGPLHYLPFHALYNGTSFLLEQHEVSYLPGASFLRYCQQASLANSGLMAIGHSHQGRLPYAVQEARSVAALLEGKTLLEDQATLAELQQHASECRTLHLAAHGDFRPDNPLFSGLALSDGWLTTLDIFSLHLKASLVTLSACQTGRNVVGGGDELLGLMRAFLYAGAASLVLSLWAVEDRSTEQLMKMFYQMLAAGKPKGQALRHAQLQLLRGQEPVHSHPYFWAPFFLVGNAGTL